MAWCHHFVFLRFRTGSIRYPDPYHWFSNGTLQSEIKNEIDGRFWCEKSPPHNWWKHRILLIGSEIGLRALCVVIVWRLLRMWSNWRWTKNMYFFNIFLQEETADMWRRNGGTKLESWKLPEFFLRGDWASLHDLARHIFWFYGYILASVSPSNLPKG